MKRIVRRHGCTHRAVRRAFSCVPPSVHVLTHALPFVAQILAAHMLACALFCIPRSAWPSKADRGGEVPEVDGDTVSDVGRLQGQP